MTSSTRSLQAPSTLKLMAAINCWPQDTGAESHDGWTDALREPLLLFSSRIGLLGLIFLSEVAWTLTDAPSVLDSCVWPPKLSTTTSICTPRADVRYSE